MRNTPASRPYILLSTLLKHESQTAVEYRAKQLADSLTRDKVPFKQLSLKVVSEKGDAPVFLLDFEDRGLAFDLAKAHSQEYLIEVNAFGVGTRVHVESQRQDAVVGKLEETLPHLLEAGDGYLEQEGGPVYTWK